jgi:myo-inositol-1(or 4)-monophosphatase
MIEILREVAEGVQKAVRPLAGTKEAGEFMKMGADGEPTVKVDAVAERVAFDVLERTGVPMVVLSEEAGLVELGENPKYICVLDPVDGTLNAVRGIPFYSTSIAIAPYRVDASINDIELGLVMNLATGDVFEAEKGEGARFNGEKIKAEDERLDESTLCVYMRNDAKKLGKLLNVAKRIRNMGSVALELSHVAKGDYHGLVDLRKLLKVTDVAAGKLILEEAGGVVACEASIMNLEEISVVACSSEKLYKNVVGLLEDVKN